MIGKKLRLAGIINGKSKKTCIVPMDHGTTYGPIEGLQNYLNTAGLVLRGGADALIVHKGLFGRIVDEGQLLSGNLIMHLSASTVMNPEPGCKVLIASVEEAVKYGAAGVSIHVNTGTKAECNMLKDFAEVSRHCMEWGMPLIAMMYGCKGAEDWKELQHLMRLAEELGADIVKINCQCSSEDFREALNGVHIPVVIAGGENLDNAGLLLQRIDCLLDAGASGVAIGRNIFQNPDPMLITELIAGVVHGKVTLQNSLMRVRTVRHTG